jgi:hypothetical protein
MNTKHDFLPSREADLLNWSANFRDQIVADPVQFGLTAAQAVQYTVLHDAFDIAYATAVSPQTNSRANIVVKNTAKAALKANARALARLVRATPGITNGQRSILGLNVPDRSPGTAVPVPEQSPLVEVVQVIGRTVRVRVRDRESLQRRGKPRGCAGAAVFSAVGDLPPAKFADWSFQATITRPVANVHFNPDVPAGSKVWIMAFWYNTRGARGPASTPMYTRVGDGVSMLRMAA